MGNVKVIRMNFSSNFVEDSHAEFQRISGAFSLLNFRNAHKLDVDVAILLSFNFVS